MSMIYTNIKREAGKKKMSIRHIEQTAGLSNGSVAKWNVVSPSVENLKKVADLLGVKIEKLLTDS